MNIGQFPHEKNVLLWMNCKNTIDTVREKVTTTIPKAHKKFKI